MARAEFRRNAACVLFLLSVAYSVAAASTAAEGDEEVAPECRRPDGRDGPAPLPGAHGCTALDVIQFPGVMLDQVLAAVEDIHARIGRPPASPALREFRPGLAHVRRAAAHARELLPDGAVCEGAAKVAQAAQVLARLETRAGARLREIESEPQADPRVGDATEQGGRWAAMHYIQVRFAQSGQLAREAEMVIDGVCRSLAPAAALRGQVSKIDDGRRRAKLTDGTLLGLTAKGYAAAPHAGSSFSASVHRLPDGTGLVAQYSPDVPDLVEINPLGCIELRVAPVQPFNPPFFTGESLNSDGRRGLLPPPQGSAPYALHRLEAYPKFSGHTLLERGMRVAAVKRPCLLDSVDSETSYHRYSLDVDLEIGTPKKTRQLAFELDPGNPPVPQPDGIDWTGSNGTLTVRYKVQECTLKPAAQPWVSRVSTSDVQACAAASGDCACQPYGPGSSCPVYPQWDDLDDYISPYECTQPSVFDVKTFLVNVVDRGAECDADYAQTSFDLEDYDTAGFRTGTVSGISPHGVLIFEPKAGLHFWADGYAAAPPAPYFGNVFLATNISVTPNQAFGVYTWEPCTGPQKAQSNCAFPDDPKTALRGGGVATASALRWPRVVGEKSGLQFAYSCRLPDLVRDVLHFCEGTPESYFRFPLSGGIWGISQGNCHCCTSCGCTHCCGCNQEFAFDILANPYNPILATRGGVVANKAEGKTQNCWGMPTCPEGAWGNFITIEHQDGTATSYMHMPGNVLLPNFGQRVRRGDLIGFTGNTGNSSDPHLHVQQQLSAVTGETTQMRFEVDRWEGLDFIHHLCRTPQEGDALVSTNAPPP
jgi:hypothetical protein